jgi:hypothetical protein
MMKIFPSARLPGMRLNPVDADINTISKIPDPSLDPICLFSTYHRSELYARHTVSFVRLPYEYLVTWYDGILYFAMCFSPVSRIHKVWEYFKEPGRCFDAPVKIFQ